MKLDTKTIMVIEDSPEDFEAMRRAFKKIGSVNPIVHCVDGEDALNFLYQRGKYKNVEKIQRPAMILLDLNLPGLDGREVLHAIKTDSDICTTPVVILTTSRDEKDIERCYTEGANCYIQKPFLLDELVLSLQRLSDFWFHTAQLPETSL